MFSIPEAHIDQIINAGDELSERPWLSLMEEMGELQTALAKFANDRVIDYNTGVSHIVEEMAHVLISMNLLCRQHCISEEDIRKEIMLKALKAGFDTTNY